jgi:hypothetical protein
LDASKLQATGQKIDHTQNVARYRFPEFASNENGFAKPGIVKEPLVLASQAKLAEMVADQDSLAIYEEIKASVRETHDMAAENNIKEDAQKYKVQQGGGEREEVEGL